MNLYEFYYVLNGWKLVEEKKEKGYHLGILLNILIAISTDYCEELLLITQVCSNSICKQRKIFYPLLYAFIVTNDYPRQVL